MMLGLDGAPALPQAGWVQVGLYLGWACVGSALVLRWCRHAVLAVCCGVVLCVPWAFAPVGFWALAFQAPSVVLVAWAIQTWAQHLRPQGLTRQAPACFLWAGVLLGWALCLDTFNLWPSALNLQLFAMGFEPASVWMVLAAWLVFVAFAKPSARWVMGSALVLLVYVLLRLPTGNVWDALLDPFVWIALHVQLWRRAFKTT